MTSKNTKNYFVCYLCTGEKHKCCGHYFKNNCSVKPYKVKEEDIDMYKYFGFNWIVAGDKVCLDRHHILKNKYKPTTEQNDQTEAHSHKRKGYPNICSRNKQKAQKQLWQDAEHISGGYTSELLVDVVLHNQQAKAHALALLEKDFQDNLANRIQLASPSKKL